MGVCFFTLIYYKFSVDLPRIVLHSAYFPIRANLAEGLRESGRIRPNLVEDLRESGRIRANLVEGLRESARIDVNWTLIQGHFSKRPLFF